MDFSELRDLLDFLENQGVDEQTLRQVFERYAPRDAESQPIGPSSSDRQAPQQGPLARKASSR